MTVIEFDPDAVARSYGEEPPVPDAPRSTRRIYRLEELAHLTSAAEDYVIGNGILTRKGKLMVVGKAGIGKTTFLDHMVACLAAQRTFLGRFAIDRPYRVLVVQPELTESELASHGQALIAVFRNTPALSNLTFVLETQMRLPRDRDALRALIREHRIEIVALDSLLEFFEGESSTQPEDVRDLLGTFDWLLAEEPQLAGVIVQHHENVAGGRGGGSWKFDAWPSTILRLEKVPGVATDRMVCFEKIRAPGFSNAEKMQITLSHEHGYLQLAGEARLPEGRTELVVQLLREAGCQLRRQDLVERVATRAGVKDRAAIGYIAQAKQEGIIAVHQVGREAVYRLADQMAAAAHVLHQPAQVQI